MRETFSDGMGFGAGWLGLVVLIFLVVLMVLWFLLPFAVFGIKRRLDQLLETGRQLNHQLRLMESAAEVRHKERFKNVERAQAPRKVQGGDKPPSSTTCPHCMQENGVGAKTCSRCGKEL